MLPQNLQQVSDGFVETCNLGIVGSQVCRNAFATIEIVKTLRCVERRVGQKRCIPNHEWSFAGVAGDEVFNGLHGFATDGQADVAVAMSDPVAASLLARARNRA